MARSTRLEVDKEGNIILTVQATKLPTGVTLKSSSPAPTVEAEMRSATDPETWILAPGVTIDQILVKDRIDLHQLPAVVVLATDQAIQFRWKKDPDPQPSPTDTPVPGDNYRAVCVAERSDGGDWVEKVPVTIHT